MLCTTVPFRPQVQSRVTSSSELNLLSKPSRSQATREHATKQIVKFFVCAPMCAYYWIMEVLIPLPRSIGAIPWRYELHPVSATEGSCLDTVTVAHKFVVHHLSFLRYTSPHNNALIITLKALHQNWVARYDLCNYNVNGNVGAILQRSLLPSMKSFSKSADSSPFPPVISW